METTNRTVIILRGVPGSGKSTYAKKLVSEGWNRVNKDEIRHMINGYKLNTADESIVHRIQEDTIRAFMAGGRNFVVDNTHTRQKYIDELLELINTMDSKIGYDYNVVIKTIDTPLNICLDRNSKRENPVMEDVIHRMHEQLFGK